MQIKALLAFLLAMALYSANALPDESSAFAKHKPNNSWNMYKSTKTGKRPKRNAEDSIGEKFGRLTVNEIVGRNKKSEAIVKAVCDCGKEIETKLRIIRAGHTASCGCLYRELQSKRSKEFTTHGFTGSRMMNIWSGMIQRCSSEKHVSYPHYGGRGIKVCNRWVKFENFLADMGVAPNGMELERINNNGNYTPKNCRWAARWEQLRNTRKTVVTVAMVIEIKRRVSSGENKSKIRDSMGLRDHAISQAMRSKTWKELA